MSGYQPPPPRGRGRSRLRDRNSPSPTTGVTPTHRLTPDGSQSADTTNSSAHRWDRDGDSRADRVGRDDDCRTDRRTSDDDSRPDRMGRYGDSRTDRWTSDSDSRTDRWGRDGDSRTDRRGRDNDSTTDRWDRDGASKTDRSGMDDDWKHDRWSSDAGDSRHSSGYSQGQDAVAQSQGSTGESAPDASVRHRDKAADDRKPVRDDRSSRSQRARTKRPDKQVYIPRGRRSQNQAGSPGGLDTGRSPNTHDHRTVSPNMHDRPYSSDDRYSPDMHGKPISPLVDDRKPSPDIKPKKYEGRFRGRRSLPNRMSSESGQCRTDVKQSEINVSKSDHQVAHGRLHSQERSVSDSQQMSRSRVDVYGPEPQIKAYIPPILLAEGQVHFCDELEKSWDVNLKTEKPKKTVETDRYEIDYTDDHSDDWNSDDGSSKEDYSNGSNKKFKSSGKLKYSHNNIVYTSQEDLSVRNEKTIQDATIQDKTMLTSEENLIVKPPEKSAVFASQEDLTTIDVDLPEPDCRSLDQGSRSDSVVCTSVTSTSGVSFNPCSSEDMECAIGPSSHVGLDKHDKSCDMLTEKYNLNVDIVCDTTDDMGVHETMLQTNEQVSSTENNVIHETSSDVEMADSTAIYETNGVQTVVLVENTILNVCDKGTVDEHCETSKEILNTTNNIASDQCACVSSETGATGISSVVSTVSPAHSATELDNIIAPGEFTSMLDNECTTKCVSLLKDTLDDKSVPSKMSEDQTTCTSICSDSTEMIQYETAFNGKTETIHKSAFTAEEDLSFDVKSRTESITKHDGRDAPLKQMSDLNDCDVNMFVTCESINDQCVEDVHAAVIEESDSVALVNVSESEISISNNETPTKLEAGSTSTAIIETTRVSKDSMVTVVEDKSEMFNTIGQADVDLIDTNIKDNDVQSTDIFPNSSLSKSISKNTTPTMIAPQDESVDHQAISTQSQDQTTGVSVINMSDSENDGVSEITNQCDDQLENRVQVDRQRDNKPDEEVMSEAEVDNQSGNVSKHVHQSDDQTEGETDAAIGNQSGDMSDVISQSEGQTECEAEAAIGIQSGDMPNITSQSDYQTEGDTEATIGNQSGDIVDVVSQSEGQTENEAKAEIGNQSGNVSDVTSQSEGQAEGDTAATIGNRSGDTFDIISQSEGQVEDDESWDAKFDENGDCLDPSAMEELTKTVGKVKIQKSKKINYLEYQPKDKAELDYTEYGHIIEIYDFSKEFVTRDLITAFQSFMSRGFDLKWVDDTHALGIFTSAVAARDALDLVHPLLKVCPLSEASRQSKVKARHSVEFLQPYKPRPETSAAAARRLVAGALGLTSNVSREKRDLERQQLKLAKEKRRQDKKNREDIWEGTVGKCAMDEEN